MVISDPLPVTVTGDTAQATADPSDPIPSCSIGALAGTVWYSYTPAVSGSVPVNLAAGAGTVPIAGLYVVDGAGNLTQRACTGGGQSSFGLTGGQTYLIMVGQYTGCCSPGPFTLTLSPAPDTTPPSISPQVSGTLGQSGWYTSDVTVSWTVNEPDSPSTLQTSGCGLTTIANDTTAAGTTLTCRATSAGGSRSASVIITRDATPPTLSCANPAPTFVLHQAAASVSATVADPSPGSGPGSLTPASPQAADTSSVGLKQVNYSATDDAGNSSGPAPCAYTVAYQVLGFFSPLGRTTWTAGATIPVKFALADVNGVRIGDAEAQAIVNNCDAKVTFTGGRPSPDCFSYDATADAFQFDLMTAKTLNGSYAITATITKAATVLDTKSVTIDIRRS